MIQVNVKENSTAEYVFSGHIHQGVTINGLGKQTLKILLFKCCGNVLYSSCIPANSPAVLIWG